MHRMVTPQAFWNHMISRGYTFFSGVPCSLLKGILETGLADPRLRYVPAVRENAALGVASGAYLAGFKSGLLMQNSGLGNIVNALTSFNLIYHIPVLLFITWRGFQGKDPPEHLIMGEKTLEILDTLGIPAIVLDDTFREDLDRAIETMEGSRVPAAVILKAGVVA